MFSSNDDARTRERVRDQQDQLHQLLQPATSKQPDRPPGASSFACLPACSSTLSRSTVVSSGGGGGEQRYVSSSSSSSSVR